MKTATLKNQSGFQNQTGPTPNGLGQDNRLLPEVMTAEEVIRYLRLDEISIKNPAATLARYRRLGKLRGTQLGKAVRYRRAEVERFLAEITEENPR